MGRVALFRRRKSVVDGRMFLLWLLGTVFMVTGTSAWSLDEKRLWLPIKYKKYHFELLASAIAAEKHSSCEEVMEGTLDLGVSTPDEPVFRILCRSADGPGFNVMVDGKTRRLLTNEQIVEELLTDPQKEQRRQQLAERTRQQLEQRKKSLWDQCEGEIRTQARDMIGFRWDEPGPPEPLELTDAGALFEKHFRSRSPTGTELFFVARCTVADGAAAIVNFRGRGAGTRSSGE